MCGICGIRYFNSREKPPVGLVQAMTDSIYHRGPDGEGAYIGEGIALSMRRLSIIDVAGGQQPISNEDGSVQIVFNGEIYNHLELRKMLERVGHRFRTTTDTEVIVHLYEEYGVKCLDHLQGMFAFALWDERKQQLFVARDRLGIKPLFYYMDRDCFIFASEMKSILLHPSVQRDLDWNGVDAYFCYNFIPAPLTIYSKVRKLLPGHYMIVDPHGAKEVEYWDLSFKASPIKKIEEIEEGFTSLMKDAVKSHLMSEVPLGAFLSGGIDSGLIVALMAETMSEPIKTFTLGFGGKVGAYLDERGYAREVSRRYRTDHEEYSVLPDGEEILGRIVRSFDEPFADDSVIPTYYICGLARKKVTVALTGLGGDENFAGYERHLGLGVSEKMATIPKFVLQKILTPMILSLREEKGGHYRVNHLKRFIQAAGLPPAMRYQSYISAMPKEERRRLYSSEVSKKIDFDYVDSLGWLYFSRCDSDDVVNRALYQDMKMYLPDDILALSDRLSMYHSLELRVPFVDHRIIEFCAGIPSRLKIKGLRKKWLLTKIAKKYLPSRVIDHRKQGFASPMAAWLNNDLKRFTEKMLDDRTIADQHVFDPRRIEIILSEHQTRRRLNDKSIFSLLMFQVWLNNFQRN